MPYETRGRIRASKNPFTCCQILEAKAFEEKRMIEELAKPVVCVTVKRIDYKLQQKGTSLFAKRTRSNCHLVGTANVIANTLISTKNVKKFVQRRKAILRSV